MAANLFICRLLCLKTAGQVRYYPRWTHRNPTRVLTPEEFVNEDNPGGHGEKQQKAADVNKIKMDKSFDKSGSFQSSEDSQSSDNPKLARRFKSSDQIKSDKLKSNDQFKSSDQIKSDKFKSNDQFKSNQFKSPDQFKSNQFKSDKFKSFEKLKSTDRFKSSDNFKLSDDSQLSYNNESSDNATGINMSYTRTKWTPKSNNSLNWNDSNLPNKKTSQYLSITEPIINTNRVPERKFQMFKPAKKISSTDMLETVLDSEGNFIYTKLKDNDSIVANLFTTIKSRKDQRKKDLILLEGKRLIRDALTKGCHLKYLIFSRKSDVESLKDYLPKSGAKLFKMPYKEIQNWSDLTTSPGIMGIFKTPNLENIEAPPSHIPLTIICDSIREPGNLGAIIRISAAVPCERLILTQGCVNLWDTKVTRSSAGAHFNQQIHTKKSWDDINNLIPNNSRVFLADNKIHQNDNNIYIDDNRMIPNDSKMMLNDDKMIPNNNQMISSESETFLQDQFSTENKISPPKNTSSQESSTKGPSSNLHSINILPVIPYYSTQGNNITPMVLIIGGETEGISEDSYKFARRRQGVRLNIPLSPNVESLNSGSALGIIVFEIKRQLNVNAQMSDSSAHGKSYINVTF